MLVLSAGAMVAGVANIDKIRSLFTKAANGSANISVLPSSVTMPPERVFQVWITPQLNVGDSGVAFVRVSLTFDPSKINLIQDPVLATPGFNKIQSTSLTQANSTGILVFVAGLDPEQRALAPRTAFQFLNIQFRTNTPTSVTTLIGVNTTDSQIADLGISVLSLTANGSTISLNPVEATPTPIIPTATRTPTVPPTRTPTPTIILTPTGYCIQPTAPWCPNGNLVQIIPPRQPLCVEYRCVTNTPTRTPTVPPTRTPTPIAVIPTSKVTQPPAATTIPSTAPTRTPTPAATGDTIVPLILSTINRYGTVGKNYFSLFFAIDKTANDVLTVRTTNLPPGLVLTNCRNINLPTSTMTFCYLTGTPTTAGVYNPSFSVIDAHRNTTTKSYILEIAPASSLIR